MVLLVASGSEQLWWSCRKLTDNCLTMVEWQHWGLYKSRLIMASRQTTVPLVIWWLQFLPLVLHDTPILGGSSIIGYYWIIIWYNCHPRISTYLVTFGIHSWKQRETLPNSWLHDQFPHLEGRQLQRVRLLNSSFGQSSYTNLSSKSSKLLLPFYINLWQYVPIIASMAKNSQAQHDQQRQLVVPTLPHGVGGSAPYPQLFTSHKLP